MSRIKLLRTYLYSYLTYGRPYRIYNHMLSTVYSIVNYIYIHILSTVCNIVSISISYLPCTVSYLHTYTPPSLPHLRHNVRRLLLRLDTQIPSSPLTRTAHHPARPWPRRSRRRLRRSSQRRTAARRYLHWLRSSANVPPRLMLLLLLLAAVST